MFHIAYLTTCNFIHIEGTFITNTKAKTNVIIYFYVSINDLKTKLKLKFWNYNAKEKSLKTHYYVTNNC